jgi:GT2 family glycosyltransferase
LQYIALLFLQKSMQLFPSVAIVILNYNGRSYLEKFLPSVLSSTYANKQVIVADNASTDESIQFLQQQYPSVQILVNKKNLGFAGGYNWALKQIKADYYVLLNSDVEVTANWIEPIIDLMEKDKAIAACQPKILSYNQKDSFEYAGAAGGWIDAFGYPFSRGRVFDVCEKDNHQYEDVQQIFWATGAAMFVRSAAFHEANGFDVFFFAHMEEIDLCWRMQLAGYSIYAVPASIVYHVGGGTLPKGFRKTFLNFRNNLIMLSKNLPLAEKLWKIPFRFALDLITALKGMLAGDTAMFKAILKAQFAVIGWWFSKKKNAKSHPPKPLKHLAGVYNQSIVWQYFIRKKKTFHEIVNNKL